MNLISPFQTRPPLEFHPGNLSPQRKLMEISGVVLHYTSCRWVDPDRVHDPRRVMRMLMDLNRPVDQRVWYPMPETPNRLYGSYHWLVPREDEPVRLLDDDQPAYHAGKSQAMGRENLNGWTLGIGLINDGTIPYTATQYIWSATLVREYEKALKKRLPVWGHNQVAPDRKHDPGDHFDWDWFNHQLNYNRYEPDEL